jgi:hypothetical protein
MSTFIVSLGFPDCSEVLYDLRMDDPIGSGKSKASSGASFIPSGWLKNGVLRMGRHVMAFHFLDVSLWRQLVTPLYPTSRLWNLDQT